MSLTLIAALTWPDRVIGKDGGIPWRLSADLKRFKALTLGHPVVMGRGTWESLPFKLPGRTNFVLSRRPLEALSRDAKTPDFLENGLESALSRAAQAPGGDAIFVIGGAALYAAALPLADRLALTLIHHPFDGDAFFPAFEPARWRQRARERRTLDANPPFDYEFLDLEKP